MTNDILFQARQNRLLAWVRAVQAGFSVLAALSEADLPGPRDNLAGGILAGYFALSLAWIGVVRTWRGASGALFLAAFVADFLVFTVVLALTVGSISPYFLLFVFLMLCATLQWGWRGAAWTTGLVLAVFVPIVLSELPAHAGHAADLPRFVMRIGNLVAVGALLVAFGRHEETVKGAMARLSGPLPPVRTAEDPPVFEGLERAAAVFGVSRALMVWGDPEEPGLRLAELSAGRRSERAWAHRPGEPRPVLGEAGEPFLWQRQGPAAFHLDGAGRMTTAPSELARSAVLEACGGRSALVMPVAATDFCGWVVLPDLRYLAHEQLYLGSAVAAQIAVAVEAWRSLIAWREAAASEQRVRLARELHDGVLQFLAATDMQLESIGRAVPDDPVRGRLKGLQEDLRAEQAQLRRLVTRMGPAARSAPGDRVDVASELQRLARGLQRQWGVRIAVEAPEGQAQAPHPLGFELLQILRETVSNAVRHGQARSVEVRVEADQGACRMVIADDGRGLEQRGEFEMEELERGRFGPWSLLNRVRALGGRLKLASAASGATVTILLPFGREAEGA